MLLDAGGYRGGTHYGGARHPNTLFGGGLPEPASPTTVIADDPDWQHQSTSSPGPPPPG
jgi:hypothetical protein